MQYFVSLSWAVKCIKMGQNPAGLTLAAVTNQLFVQPTAFGKNHFQYLLYDGFNHRELRLLHVSY